MTKYTIHSEDTIKTINEYITESRDKHARVAALVAEMKKLVDDAADHDDALHSLIGETSGTVNITRDKVVIEPVKWDPTCPQATRAVANPRGVKPTRVEPVLHRRVSKGGRGTGRFNECKAYTVSAETLHPETGKWVTVTVEHKRTTTPSWDDCRGTLSAKFNYDFGSFGVHKKWRNFKVDGKATVM